MPEISGTLRCELHVTAGPRPMLENELQVTGTGVDLDNTLTVTASTGFTRPRSLTPQDVAFKVVLDGVEVDRRHMGAITTTRAAEGSTWSLQALTRGMQLSALTGKWETFLSALGSPADHLGAVPGSKKVDIVGTYQDSSGTLHEFPLVTSGLAADSTRRGKVDSIQGVGPEGRYDRTRVTYTQPPGHNHRRDKVIRDIALLLGVPSGRIALPLMKRMNKEISLLDGNGWALAKDIAAAEVRVLHFDRSGNLVAPKMIPSAGAPSILDLTEEDILKGSFSWSASGDIPTAVKVTGQRQVTSEACGLVTLPPQEVSAEQNYAPKRARWKQNGTHTLASVHTSDGTLELRLVSLTVRIVEKRCDTIISERIKDYEWTAQGRYRYRYKLDTTGDFNSASSNPETVYIMEPGAVAGDSSPGFAVQEESFQQTGELFTVNLYDSRGMRTGISVKRWGWEQRSAPLKRRNSLATAWDGISFGIGATPVKANADGRGVADEDGAWQLLEQSDTEIEVDDDGFVHSETTKKQEMVHQEGGKNSTTGFQYLYADGVASPDQTDALQVTLVERSAYVSKDGQTTAVRTVRNQRGELVEPIRTESIDGYLPAAEQDLSVLAGTEEGLAASRQDAEPLVAECFSSALLAHHLPWTLEEGSEWIESEEEAEALCVAILRRRSAHDISLSLPANFSIDRYQVVHVEDPESGFDGDVVIEQIGIPQQAPGGVVVTQVAGAHLVI